VKKGIRNIQMYALNTSFGKDFKMKYLAIINIIENIINDIKSSLFIV
tara:strand:- start:471 stop:611 length:141 start_codon:yes stop_codon:yes gene_type:complete